MATIKEVLANSELFRGLTGEELEKVAALARVEVHEMGATLFTEGSAAEDLYIIEIGRVAMDMSLSPTPGVGKQTTVETLTKGQIFGWSAVGGTPVYIMTARAVQPVRLIAINGRRLHSLLDENRNMGYSVIARLVGTITGRLGDIRMTLRIFHR